MNLTGSHMPIKVIGTGFFHISSFLPLSKTLLLSLLSRNGSAHTPSSPARQGFPARWPVVAPPRRSSKTPPNSKKISVLNILFLAKPKSGLRISKTNSYKSRSRNKDSKKVSKKYLYSLSPVRFGCSLPCSGSVAPVRACFPSGPIRLCLFWFGSDFLNFGFGLCLFGTDFVIVV
ncbi:hypothetical protein MtrunA17_Chr7g0216161 [Medicago truncatula]|uniref:Uncharacterized protein n=1 Tax=Medicago truncatula TaxID=3880 RepID=A0A396GXH0_MEDTR|nr:hypothetical protein MtrunA17_Chr7g0216161 [Medicago truncatula]